TQTHKMEAEDLGTSLLTFQNGAYGMLTCSTSIHPGFKPCLGLYGKKGTIQLKGTDIVHWTVPGIPKPLSREASSSEGGVSDPMSISTEYHKMQLEDFVNALQIGASPSVKGGDNR